MSQLLSAPRWANHTAPRSDAQTQSRRRPRKLSVQKDGGLASIGSIDSVGSFGSVGSRGLGSASGRVRASGRGNDRWLTADDTLRLDSTTHSLEIENLDSPQRCVDQIADLCFGNVAPVNLRVTSPLRARIRPSTATSHRRPLSAVPQRQRPQSALAKPLRTSFEEDASALAASDGDGEVVAAEDEEDVPEPGQVGELAALTHLANERSRHMMALLEKADQSKQNRALQNCVSQVCRPSVPQAGNRPAAVDSGATFAETYHDVMHTIEKLTGGGPRSALIGDNGLSGWDSHKEQLMSLGMLGIKPGRRANVPEKKSAEYLRAQVNAAARFEMKMKSYRDDAYRLEELKERVAALKVERQANTRVAPIIQRNKTLTACTRTTTQLARLSHENKVRQERTSQARALKQEQTRELERKKDAIAEREMAREERLARRKMGPQQKVWLTAIASAVRIALMRENLANHLYVRWTRVHTVDPAVRILRDALFKNALKMRIRQKGKLLLAFKRALFRHVTRLRIRLRRRAVGILKDYLADLRNMQSAARAVRKFRRNVVRLQRFFLRTKAVHQAQVFMLHRQWERAEAEVVAAAALARRKKKTHHHKKKRTPEEEKARRKKKKEIKDNAPPSMIVALDIGTPAIQPALEDLYSDIKRETIAMSFETRKAKHRAQTSEYRNQLNLFLREHKAEIDMELAKAALAVADADSTLPTSLQIAQRVLADQLPSPPPRFSVQTPQPDLDAQVAHALHTIKEKAAAMQTELEAGGGDAEDATD